MEPIAIIGIGCRFPGGASDPHKFWKLLCDGVDAVSEVPKDRWDWRRFFDRNMDAAGKMYVKQGAFLSEKWEDFDAEFFQISPREAPFLDPQQRLLLEVAWEAMEDGGIVPAKIRDSETGVFIGSFTSDWQTLHNSPYNTRNCGVYSGINGSRTILSARLSHFFDLKGPCLTIDTACSSSLVAIHLACQSLRYKECSLALAGGVNAMVVPETTIAMSKGRFLSPQGRCFSFDSNADGYVRGEGGGIVLLKRLSDAINNKDPIYAVIRATGINQDGHTPGIAHPCPDAQRSLIEKVLLEGSVRPDDISYVEAHGTGTQVGDPIEALALNQVLSIQEKRSHPCYLGSVKTNFGHLEAAAGIAGLIKTSLCLKNGKIPPNLHFKAPNPNIPFDKYCLKIPVKLEDFPHVRGQRIACVNSFGYGGTNAHAVLQNYETKVEKEKPASFSNPIIFPFSAKNLEALKGSILNIEAYFRERPETKLVDIAYTLARKRSFFGCRLGVCAQSLDELLAKLSQWHKGIVPEGCVQGQCLNDKPGIAFIYTGMGPQWWGMGRQLMQNSSQYMEFLNICDRHLSPIAGFSIVEELYKHEDCANMGDPIIAQTANFCVQAALTDLLKSWGITPGAVAGHSIGEVAAAYASGALALKDCLLIAYHRSRLQSTRKDQGTMLAAGIGLQEAHELLNEYQGKISIAAVNSPNSLTLSGRKDDLETLAENLESRNIFNRFLKVNVAYHSHQMDGLENEVRTVLSKICPSEPSIPLYSTVNAEECNKLPLDANYWWQNIRQPVLFSETIQKMIAKGYRIFVEVGPHPVLHGNIKECLQHCQEKGAVIGSLNRKQSDVASLMECLEGLYVNGHDLNWDLLHPAGGCFIPMPTYPWQRKSHWIESEESRQYRLSSQHHVMLSRRLKIPEPAWQVEINSHYFPWLNDHKIDETVIFPAAAYIEAGLEIYDAHYGNGPCMLEDLEFKQALALSEENEPLLQISLQPETRLFSVHSQQDRENFEWACHAIGKCTPDKSKASKLDFSELQKGLYLEEDSIYRQFALQGLEYGHYFRNLKKLWKGHGEALAEIHSSDFGKDYILNPTLLDAAFQTLIGTIDPTAFNDELIIPFRLKKLIFHQSPRNRVFCYARCLQQTDSKLIGDLAICDEFGNVLVQIKGLYCRAISKNSVNKSARFLYQPSWEECPLKGTKGTENQIGQIWLAGFFNEAECLHFSRFIQENKIKSHFYSPNELKSLKEAEALIEPFSNVEHLNVVLSLGLHESNEKLEHTESELVYACINLVKAIDKFRKNQSTTLLFVTKGTQHIEGYDHPMNLKGASIWGLIRVIRHEFSSLRCLLIDLDHQENCSDEAFVSNCLYSQEDEIALRQGRRYVYKLKKYVPVSRSQNKIRLSSPEHAFALDLPTPGLIESLYYKQVEKTQPAAEEVSIQVSSASLNFKDLMKVLGMLDANVMEDTYFGASFGMECSGTVVAVGSKVRRYKIGDKVCAFIPNTFRSCITLPAKYIFPIPPSDLDKAPVYVPFITVLRALKDIARLKKGETVLIHSGTGAVGHAAIQYAQHVGAKVIATAGNNEKKEYLMGLGVDKCGDSRSLSFVEDVLEWTNGKGVDVVLNSLSGDALTKSWSLLAPYGRFVEIGKRDISANLPLPMGNFNTNTSFAAVDLDRIFVERPKIIHRLLKEAHSLFQKGSFKPLPCKIFLADQAVEAFKFMSRGQHIGKIMLNFEGQAVDATPLSSFAPIVDSSHSYLITGGLKGFGLVVANWLAEKGAKHLILISRSGATLSEACQTIQNLKEKGVSVKVAAVDVSDYDQMKLLFKECRKEMPPIKGIVHSAMLLHDSLVPQLSLEAIQEVMMPKVAGCLNLHRLTNKHPLDFFILFSSVSSIIGNPGQGNYAAANAFLDSFCHYRHSLGLPGKTINWGALNTGILARNKQVSRYLESHGIKGIHERVALKLLETAIHDNSSQLCALDINWQKLMESMPLLKKSSGFADFAATGKNAAMTTFAERLSGMDKSECYKLIVEMMQDILGKTLRMDPAKVDISVRLNTLGVDSLMAMELQANLEQTLGVKIPTMELIKGPTIEQLTKLSLKLLNIRHPA